MIFDQLDFKEEKVMDNEKIEKLQQMIDESDHIVFFGAHKTMFVKFFNKFT